MMVYSNTPCQDVEHKHRLAFSLEGNNMSAAWRPFVCNVTLPAGVDGKSGGGEEEAGPEYQTWQSVVIIFCCFLIIVGTVIGNVLVCMAVAIVRKLRTPSNLLIVSLAVSDLLVALLVMSLAAMYEVSKFVCMY